MAGCGWVTTYSWHVSTTRRSARYWLAETDHMTQILASDWWTQFDGGLWLEERLEQLLGVGPGTGWPSPRRLITTHWHTQSWPWGSNNGAIWGTKLEHNNQLEPGICKLNQNKKIWFIAPFTFFYTRMLGLIINLSMVSRLHTKEDLHKKDNLLMIFLMQRSWTL